MLSLFCPKNNFMPPFSPRHVIEATDKNKKICIIVLSPEKILSVAQYHISGIVENGYKSIANILSW